jgi:glycosyltransferase involved in cell wall biosynthesis
MHSKSMLNEVLFLSYDGLTDPLGQSQILPYMCGVAAKGHSISIISFEKQQRYSSAERTIREQCENAGLNWHPQTYHKSPPVISTLYDLFVLWQVANRLVRDRSIKIIHCRSYLTALIGLRLKHKYGVKLIFDMRGFWADERVEGRLWSLDKPLYRFIYNYFKRAERRLVKESDCVVVLTQAAKEQIVQWKLRDRIEVIPCCVDLNLFNPELGQQSDRVGLRSTLGIGAHDFVLLYLGSLGTWYMTDEMLAFYEKLRDVRPDAKFLMLTPDIDAAVGKGIISLMVQRKEVPKYIAIADASICFIKPSFSKKGSSATKMAEVLAMNVPVVSNSGWGDQEFLRERVNGLILIKAADGVPEELFQLSHGAGVQTEFFREYFSLETGIAKYNQIYVELR